MAHRWSSKFGEQRLSFALAKTLKIRHLWINPPNLIIKDGKIEFSIGKKVFDINVNKLYMKKNQYYRIKNAGLSKINENDIYDVSNKSDIIVNITLI